MFHLQNFKTMKANVMISAVKKEFKNGQQGWQVFVDGMEGRLRCEMNFKDSLKAMRYCFLLSKRLDLQINDIQLAALSLDYQRAKDAVDKAVEDATQVAGEVAAEFGEAEEQAEAAPEEEQPAALGDSPLFKQFCDLKSKHPDALLLFRTGEFYTCYEEDAITASAVLALTDIIGTGDNISIARFPYHCLDTYLPRLIRAGHRIAICDQLEEPKNLKPTETVAPVQQELFTNE